MMMVMTTRIWWTILHSYERVLLLLLLAMPGAWWPGRRERVGREHGDYNMRPRLGIADGRTEETAVIELLLSYYCKTA